MRKTMKKVMVGAIAASVALGMGNVSFAKGNWQPATTETASESLTEEESTTEEFTSEICEEQPIREERETREEKPAREERETREEKPVREEKETCEEKPVREEKETREEKPVREEKETREEKPASEEKESTEETTEETEKEETESKKEKSKNVVKVTCTSSGRINVSFKEKVEYTDSVKVTLLDEDGEEVACEIVQKNKKLMGISTSGLVKDQKYTLTIQGVLVDNASESGDITTSFVAKGMKTACKVSKVTVSKKKFVTMKMKSSAYYKDAEVVVKDEDGNVIEAKIVKKSKGNIKIQVSGLEKGEKYTVTVTGVKTKKEKNYSSITKTFTAK